MSQDNPDYTFTIKCRETGPDGIDRITNADKDADRIVITDDAVKLHYNDTDGPHFYLPLRHFFGYDRVEYETVTEAGASGEVAA